MKKKQIQRGIAEVANQHHISEDEVKREIESCIAQTWKKIQEEQNEELLNLWKEIPSASKVPTAEELITYAAEKLRKQLLKER